MKNSAAIFSNNELHGGKFLQVVRREFQQSSDAAIASGYVSHDVIREFEPEFYRLANNGGRFRLLLGMAFYEGLSARNLLHLEKINKALRESNSSSGIYVSYANRYHGKMYSFINKEGVRAYIGSSNFSRSGLSENWECTARIDDENEKSATISYLEFLFNQENAVSITDAEITVPGSEKYKARIALSNLDDLQRYDTSSIDKTNLQFFDYPLERIAEKERSNLNVYFGKGRWSRSTGKVAPRPWYEVELIANREINSQPMYPKGEFTAYTDDGFIMPMRTSGDYFKNIRSRGNLKLLGQWIKGKLQRANVLIPLTPVTVDTLEKYGKMTIRFYKMKEGEYFIEF
ncbi:MAG: restriction endonuclease PLD domain-containing protein [Candidatus Andersenbacteria bacterium]